MTASTWFNYGVATAVLGGVGSVSGLSGNATIFSGSTVLCASGGTGGSGKAQSSTAGKVSIPGVGIVGYSGDITNAGENGQPGLMISQVVGIGGAGGGQNGASATVAAGNGNNAIGPGGGGGGALLITSGTQSGGSGGAGVLIIDEYSA
jgi:hypothetical protein